ncbi:hypothetical protein GCM10011369_01290 [Neiella marina]|uniref:Uncharacterized protein n=1 Tax=Neiella marina TaxID=508461 RepID=A0A8J2XKR7_9GAMM|nr:hypothetical protein [Neiella marina]GGA63689.1 hypothetical protein GCM10011369_01290 [Neiella marina]
MTNQLKWYKNPHKVKLYLYGGLTILSVGVGISLWGYSIEQVHINWGTGKGVVLAIPILLLGLFWESLTGVAGGGTFGLWCCAFIFFYCAWRNYRQSLSYVLPPETHSLSQSEKRGCLIVTAILAAIVAIPIISLMAMILR